MPNKMFIKMLNQGTSPENQKKVMLLFNKNAQQNLLKQEEIAKKNGIIGNEGITSGLYLIKLDQSSRPQSRAGSNVRSQNETRVLQSMNKSLKKVDKEVL